MLKYTYVFAFYLGDGPEKNLFEYLQQELEGTTEKLSELLEKAHVPKTTLIFCLSQQTREKRVVMDTTQLARNRLNHLLQGVEEGLTLAAKF